MDKDTIRRDEKQIDYSVIQQIREHAKKYDSAPDKKNFLRNVCAYEQKVILLESRRPYDVITYLHELDLKSTRLVLSELTFDEISKALELFTAEDKESFYSNFPELSLVNAFITCDKNSSEYIKELPFDRKVELIDSSSASTVLASSKVYESMTTTEKAIAVKSMDSVNAIDALNKTSEYKEDQTSQEQKSTEKEQEKHKDREMFKEQLKIEPQKKLETEEERQLRIKINDFLRANIQLYIEKNKFFETLDINAEDLYSLLTPELKDLVDRDFDLEQEKQQEETQENLLELNQEQVESQDIAVSNESEAEFYEKYSIIGNGEDKVNIVKNIGLNETFERAKMNCEQVVIDKAKETIQNQHLENASPEKNR